MSSESVADSGARNDTQQLARYDAACRALAEAKTFDEVKDIHDKAAAVKAYAKQAKNKQLEIDAAEIRLRAERRLGELLAAQKATGGLAKGGQPYQSTGSKREPVEIPPLAEVGIDKKLSSRAQKLAAVPEEEFEFSLTEWRERVQQENERVTTSLVRRGERVQRDQELKPAPKLEGEYDVIYADPPWRYDYSKTESRDIENQYPTMSLDELCALSVPAANDCILYLWATSPKLAESLKVIEAWGFTYKTCAIWDKERMGMGYHFRQQHELLLVATKGTPGTPPPDKRPSSVFRVRRDNKHSKKPPEIAALIREMTPGKTRAELFQRDPAEGFDGWGNQS